MAGSSVQAGSAAISVPVGGRLVALIVCRGGSGAGEGDEPALVGVPLCSDSLELLEDLVVPGSLLLDELPELGVLGGKDVAVCYSLLEGGCSGVRAGRKLLEEGIGGDGLGR